MFCLDCLYDWFVVFLFSVVGVHLLYSCLMWWLVGYENVYVMCELCWWGCVLIFYWLWNFVIGCLFCVHRFVFWWWDEFVRLVCIVWVGCWGWFGVNCFWYYYWCDWLMINVLLENGICIESCGVLFVYYSLEWLWVCVCARFSLLLCLFLLLFLWRMRMWG